MNINLNAKPFAQSIDRGYNANGEVYDIEVLNSRAVLDAWDAWFEQCDVEPDTNSAFEMMRDWCHRNNIFFYGACKDEFSMREALDMAANSCSQYLLIDCVG